jgi:hypothetical protein
MVFKLWIDPSNQPRDLRPHSSLNIELRNRHGTKAWLTDSPPLKLASVQLPGHPRCSLKAKRVILDLRPQLSMITDLDEVLNAWHEG